MAPRVYSTPYFQPYTFYFVALSAFRSHFANNLEGIDNPFIALGASSFVFAQVLWTWRDSPTGLIPWFSNWGKYLLLLCCITLSSSREKPTQASLRQRVNFWRCCLRSSKKNFWRRCRGRTFVAVAEEFLAPLPGRKIKSRTHPSRCRKLISCIYFVCQLSLVFLSPTSPICLFPFAFSFAFSRLLFVRLCACLLAEVTMNENTKLCDFSNTNNNDFISTPIAPATSAESYEINAALLNLVMKEQFSGLPSEDAASHLNTFIELCDMQKKKDVENDVIKLKFFPFLLWDRAKTWFSSLPKNNTDSRDKCKDAYIS